MFAQIGEFLLQKLRLYGFRLRKGYEAIVSYRAPCLSEEYCHEPYKLLLNVVEPDREMRLSPDLSPHAQRDDIVAAVQRKLDEETARRRPGVPKITVDWMWSHDRTLISRSWQQTLGVVKGDRLVLCAVNANKQVHGVVLTIDQIIDDERFGPDLFFISHALMEVYLRSDKIVGSTNGSDPILLRAWERFVSPLVARFLNRPKKPR